jgi:tRNA pseudouridine13 synthase
MEESGIDPASLAHKQKELALPGSYRKLMQRPLHMTWRVMYYDDPELPLAPTDLTTLRGLPEPDSIEGGRLTAARLEFTLPASTYATMCLRELTKQSTELAHQMSLNERSVSGAPQQPKPAEGLDATTNGATTGAAEE